MSPYTKAALFLIRLIGAGFIVFGLVLLAADLVLVLSHRPAAGPGTLALKGALFLIGSAICFKSHAMAEYLTKDLGD